LEVSTIAAIEIALAKWAVPNERRSRYWNRLSGMGRSGKRGATTGKWDRAAIASRCCRSN